MLTYSKMTTIDTSDFLVFSPAYNTNLAEYGVNKPFALDRGQRVIDTLEHDLGKSLTYTCPGPITDDEILLVHAQTYLASLNNPDTWLAIFDFAASEYNPQTAQKPLTALLDDIRLKCGGTLSACKLAVKHGLAANLGGGYHHAFPNEGRGFCVLHDIAIACRSLLKQQLVRKILIVDLDFHQGDGTALIFQNDPNVFTLSVHSEEGWPEEKQSSSLDIPILSSETHLYQQKVENAVSKALLSFTPDLVIYVAGSDPYEFDVLPGTKYIQLSLEQMRQRDEFVINTFANKKIPLAMVFAGGYGPCVWEVHYWAVRCLLERVGVFPNEPSHVKKESKKY